MTTYNTGNPIGSKDPRDLYDNAENLDTAVNDTSRDTWSDRLGRSRKTMSGMEQAFDSDQAYRESRFNDFIAASGYQFLGDYTAGIEITEYNQILRDADGEFWRVSGQVELPYTTTGAGIPEGGALVPAGDAVLRQDLANPDMGAAMVARGVVSVDSIADLLSLPEEQRKEGLRYLIGSFGLVENKGGGEFVYDPLRPKANHNGGSIISASSQWDGSESGLDEFLSGQSDPDNAGLGCFVRLTNVENAYSWGFSERDDNGPSLRAALAAVSVLEMEQVFDVATPSETSRPIVLEGKGVGGLRFAENITGLTINHDDCVLSGVKFIKAGSFSTTGYQRSLIDCSADSLTVSGCSFVGQHQGLNFRGNGLKVQGSTFSDGTWMLRLHSSKNVNITGNYFTRGIRRPQTGEGEPQGDGIKISGGADNGNIVISGNVFYDCYRDAIDLYTGGHRIAITGNVIYNANIKALDIKCRASESVEGPLMRDCVVSGNYIYSDIDRIGLSDDESYVHIDTILDENWPGGIPLTKEDVQQYGIRNVKVIGNIIEHGYPALISCQASYGIEIAGNTIIANSAVSSRLAWSSRAWETRIVGNIITAGPNRLNFSQGREIEFIGNKCRNVGLDMFERTGWRVESNTFIGGEVSNTVGGDGHTIRGNMYSEYTVAGIRVVNNATNILIDSNEFRDNTRAILVDSLTNPDARNIVINNASMRDGGGFTNIDRITDTGGIVEGNISV